MISLRKLICKLRVSIHARNPQLLGSVNIFAFAAISHTATLTRPKSLLTLP